MVEPEERKIGLPPTLGLFVFQLGVVGGADWVSLAGGGRLAHSQQNSGGRLASRLAVILYPVLDDS